MYTVLLVDDEELVLDSIAGLIHWERHGFRLTGTATNGANAMERFRQEPVDIVITDIRMPVMNGLQLIERLKGEYASTEYIVLTGYGDYEYTGPAMALGVRHYLLKPSNEVKILEVLLKVAEELTERRRHGLFLDRLQNDYKKMLPHAKDQLLRDIVLTGIYNKQDADYMMDVFKITQQRFQLMLFTFHHETEYFQRFALKNIAEEVFKEEGAYLTTIINDQILLLVNADAFEAIADKAKNVQRIYKSYYKLAVIVAISDEGGFSSIRSMYESVKHCLNYGFTFQEGYIVTPQDVMKAEGGLPLESCNLTEQLAAAVRTGNVEGVSKSIAEAVRGFESGLFETKEARNYCLDLYLAVIRQSEGALDEFVPRIPALYNMSNLQGAFQLLEQTASELAQRNASLTAKRQSDVIDSVLQIIKENIGNPDLSLKWIGNELLYVNVDYLGKLFTKKTGSKFSSYLIRLRMESAVKLMEEARDLKVYDIAVRTGYPEDAQYFSKVFKKYTGKTPTEYMRNLESNS
ncbi:response regulator [Paenibacillus sp. HB172176]|uniref:response regulator transcription factor n=1 Tax=Paenibacillus sp. HB172176 TaxID=2493690 RepID=UPI00143A3C44|nr:response regulator [Paenibacillus sp. HB172176]